MHISTTEKHRLSPTRSSSSASTEKHRLSPTRSSSSTYTEKHRLSPTRSSSSAYTEKHRLSPTRSSSSTYTEKHKLSPTRSSSSAYTEKHRRFKNNHKHHRTTLNMTRENKQENKGVWTTNNWRTCLLHQKCYWGCLVDEPKVTSRISSPASIQKRPVYICY